MGRRGSSHPLAIWANGELVGRWTPATRRPMELRYEDSWLASRSARPLSLSLPLPLVGNEASLTAESKGVLKDTTVLDAVPPLAERYNMVHKGTSVIQGGDSIACHAPPQTSSVRGRAFGFS